MAHHGEADSYYNDHSVYQQHLQPAQTQQHQQPLQIQSQPPAHPPPRPYDVKNEQHYRGATFVPPQANQQDFQQTFKITEPKWIDLWAGVW
jgi:hypothetical protein